MGIVNEIRGWANAVSDTADEIFPVEAEMADDYEATAGLLAALSAGSAYITYRVVEIGTPVTGRDTLISLGATVLSSVSANFFYNKSQDSRQE